MIVVVKADDHVYQTVEAEYVSQIVSTNSSCNSSLQPKRKRLNDNQSQAAVIDLEVAIAGIQLPSNSSSTTGPIPTIESMFQLVAITNAAVQDLSHSSSSAV